MASKLVSVKTAVATGIGAALFFVLMRFVAIPVGFAPNINLQLAPAILVTFAAIFGPVAGLFIGFIGHTLVDLTWGGVWWSWVIADGVFGFLNGIFWRTHRIEDGEFGVKKVVIFNVIQILANAVAWIGIAPVLDILIFQEPANKVYLQGVTAAVTNSIVVLILGTILALGYSRTRTKTGSLKQEG
ncbi:MAG: ECF-type riboflavin transporter substrate-binding protein [Treponema sp.]|jgi:energy-coupling factor transport system substrate-specific component|nr:ECF-type riboflavin transporter substrate-binding protein [Treponema sp.]